MRPETCFKASIIASELPIVFGSEDRAESLPDSHFFKTVPEAYHTIVISYS